MALVESVRRVLEYNGDISPKDLAETLNIEYEVAAEILRELRNA
jgi:ribosomal protein S25